MFAKIRMNIVFWWIMQPKTLHEKILFGLKVKQARQRKKLSFSELAEKTGLSISYLNEIEKGKKYPKEDKVAALAAGLGLSFEQLVSAETDQSLAPVQELLKSNFLNELPLELFGIELPKVVELIANAPVRVSAFISTLLDLSRNYALKEENFYFGALRAYLELNNNYFEDLEAQVLAFCETFKIPPQRPLELLLLEDILKTAYGYQVMDKGLDAYPELTDLRAVFVPSSRQLLLNSQLNAVQKSFEYGKEIGFNYLQIKERAYTSSILKGKVFDEVLNHSRAIYFSVALHLPKDAFVQDMQAFFRLPRWDGAAFLAVMNKYGATPEMFFHRLTNILPAFFGLKKLFFLRFIHDPVQDAFSIDKELHLYQKHHPHGNALSEHYCRRWVSVSILQDLHRMQKAGQQAHTVVAAQRSVYEGTDDQYLCFTLARPAYPSPDRNVSVTIGIHLEGLSDTIRFAGDPGIQERVVNNTCERCPIRDCAERSAPPVVVTRKNKAKAIQKRLDALLGDVQL